MTKKHIMFIVGLMVTGVALWYSTRQVSLAEFVNSFKHFHFIWLVPALVTFYFGMYLRAVRWGLLFRPHYDLKGYQLFKPIMICFGFNSLFPARVGEFVRALYVGKREKTGVTTAVATVLAERILDGVTLLGLLALALWSLPPIDPTISIHLWGKTVTAHDFNAGIHKIIIGCIVLTAGVIVFMIPWTQVVLNKIIRRMPFLPVHFKEKMVHLLMQFAQGFHALQQPWVLTQIIFHSLVLWILVGISNWTVAKGFGLPMNPTQGVALVTLIGIAIVIPAAPGYWGLFEAGTIFSLLVLGVERDPTKALAYALMIHLVQYLPLVVFGMLFAWQAQIKPGVEAEAAATAEGSLSPEEQAANVKSGQ